jgi:ribonuclease HI
MQFLCTVVETRVTYRTKTVRVEADSQAVVNQMRQFIHDEADQMTGGWRSQTDKRFDVLMGDLNNQDRDDLETITIEIPIEEVQRGDG